MTTNKQRIAIERRIASRIVIDAIAQGYSISVNDGEETTLTGSRDKSAILAAMFTTDDDRLTFHTSADKYIGCVWLIYGNGCDVIHDYHDNATMNAILRNAARLADQLEAWKNV